MTPFEACLINVKRKYPSMSCQEQINMTNYCLNHPNYNSKGYNSAEYRATHAVCEELRHAPEPKIYDWSIKEEKQTENEVELDNPIRQLCFSELIIFVHKHE